MVRSIIVDDELKSRESLKILLTDFSEGVEVLALCETVNEALEAIAKYKPDVVFLDIQMRRETGFDLLKQLPKIDFEVVFTTAHSEYAIKAFQFSAIDYLLKPVDINDLNRAISKVKNRNIGDFSQQLNHLLENLKPHHHQINKIAIPSHEGILFVKVEDVIYLEASSNYTQFYLKNGQKHLVSKSLKEYDQMLTDHNFYRIHHSYLININEVTKYVRGDGGYVILSNNVNLDVSKRKKEAFLQKLGV
ncbi:DNA-binding response regulator [Marivirga lumbricoides]|uniref:DNA-binding response regulator n=1 Tax=Marivirga lumbricoides TaxID=1046115 RepID=A0A2T4DQ84_9BACT|nr:DNA-binding response regulator [Marivirga lumbricoides]GGC51658.1 DNA-binding response regulator [Marivirga lumbricoides]